MPTAQLTVKPSARRRRLVQLVIGNSKPPSSTSTPLKCGHLKMKVVLEDTKANSPQPKANLSKIEMSSFMTEMGGGMKIGIVNMDDLNMSEWSTHSETVPVKFERVSEYFEWKYLFPEWIDEKEETDVTTCPEVPMPELRQHGYDSGETVVQICMDMDDIAGSTPLSTPGSTPISSLAPSLREFDTTGKRLAMPITLND
ncbi:UDP-glucuronate:xylan alpha-glucuronosyltransferase 2 [Morella rubra]|uniref:UDP-glucuronate:xylan alpha-glucuronosyltransferase 2 n=1 Tax=Morella rubra TaxID=262757 RepID=A0A6A1WSJ9_9ROSI|nr:UDP-glucuronate:xylan alpha-glucuronosyltransferase 2 [Morella rubra]